MEFIYPNLELRAWNFYETKKKKTPGMNNQLRGGGGCKVNFHLLDLVIEQWAKVITQVTKRERR